MTRRRVAQLVQAGLALLALLAAVGIVHREVRAATAADEFVDVGPNASAEIVVSSHDAPRELTGSFRVESVRDHPRLRTTTEYEDPVARRGGRVVVAVIDCDCPVNDDVYPPPEFAVDAEGRRWEDQYLSGGPDTYVETEGLAAPYDIGESESFRYVVVFVVPAEVGGSVRIVLQRPGRPAHRFSR